MLFDLFTLEISEGALANMLEAAKPAFERQTSLIKARLLAGTAIQSDETGVRVGKKGWWLWVFHYGDSACFVIRPSRGKKVVAEFLGEFRPDFCTHSGKDAGYSASGGFGRLFHGGLIPVPRQ